MEQMIANLGAHRSQTANEPKTGGEPKLIDMPDFQQKTREKPANDSLDITGSICENQWKVYKSSVHRMRPFFEPRYVGS
jgi:hypothetical protein